MSKQIVLILLLALGIVLVGAGIVVEVGYQSLLQWSAPVFTGNQVVDSAILTVLAIDFPPVAAFFAMHASPVIVAMFWSAGTNLVAFLGTMALLMSAIYISPVAIVLLAVYIGASIAALSLSGMLLSAGTILGVVSFLEVLPLMKTPQKSGAAG